LRSVFPYQARPGDSVTLTGTGFTEGMSVSFGTAGIATASNVTRTSAKVTIPATLGYGDYVLGVSNSTGSQKNTTSQIHLVVTANPAQAPTITSITPSYISNLNTPITVTGTGFTANNTIFTGFGKINNVVSSNGGKTLTFTPSQLSDVSKINQILSTKQNGMMLYIDFYIFNENGITQKPTRFNVQ
ncbi:MAG: hypothetical protein K0S38_945, partial [Candidatus Paceibacter sp.]|nr:hypothetical protein [Candidatus Paceibacter sp.]